MTARRAKRTPTPKATGTALRTTPGGRASATPKNQCRRLNAETRGRRAPPARAEAIAPRLVPHRPAQQRPCTGRDDRRTRTSGGRDSRRSRIRRGDHRQPVRRHPDGLPCAEGLAPPVSKSRPLRRLNGSGRVSKNRERPGLSRHAGGGSTSREQFAATFPRVPLLYCQSNMVASRSGLGNRPL